MWRYVSYPLSMLCGVNGLVLATLHGFHYLFGYTMPADATTAVAILGSATGLVAGFVQSYHAVEAANDRAQKELELKNKHALWAREEQAKQSEWERNEKSKVAEAERKGEEAKLKFERDYRLNLDKLVGMPDPDLVSPPDAPTPIKPVRKERG